MMWGSFEDDNGIGAWYLLVGLASVSRMNHSGDPAACQS